MESSTGLILGGLIGVIIYIVPMVLWIWALIHVIKSDFKDNATKVIWFIVVFFLFLLGAIIYYFAGRPVKEIVSTQTE